MMFIDFVTKIIVIIIEIKLEFKTMSIITVKTKSKLAESIIICFIIKAEGNIKQMFDFVKQRKEEINFKEVIKNSQLVNNQVER